MKRFANINGELFITDETVYVSLCNPNLYYIKGIDTFEELPMPSNEDKIFTYKRKKVKIRPAFYRNGCIAILAIPEESEDSFDYYTLTVNLYEMNLMSFSSFVYVDINNEPEALDFLIENGIAEKTPFTKQNRRWGIYNKRGERLYQYGEYEYEDMAMSALRRVLERNPESGAKLRIIDN